MFLKVNAPRNYPEMLSRIMTFTSTTIFINLLLMYFFIDTLNTLVKGLSDYFIMKLDVTDVSIFGISFTTISILIIFIFSKFIGYLFRLSIFHDKISDFLQIRERFDISIIITPLLNELGIALKSSEHQKIASFRKDLMDKLFYNFVGTDEPKINIHYVYMALDCWSFYWILVESITVFSIFSVVFFAFGELVISIILLYINAVFFLLLHIRYKKCIKVTREELRQIIQLHEFKEIEKSEIYDIFS